MNVCRTHTYVMTATQETQHPDATLVLQRLHCWKSADTQVPKQVFEDTTLTYGSIYVQYCVTM